MGYRYSTDHHIVELQYADDCSPRHLTRILTACSKCCFLHLQRHCSSNQQENTELCRSPPPKHVCPPSLLMVIPLPSSHTSPPAFCPPLAASMTTSRSASVWPPLPLAVSSGTGVSPSPPKQLCTRQSVSRPLYGSETWTPYEMHIRTLEAFHIRCLQRILGRLGALY